MQRKREHLFGGTISCCTRGFSLWQGVGYRRQESQLLTELPTARSSSSALLSTFPGNPVPGETTSTHHPARLGCCARPSRRHHERAHLEFEIGLISLRHEIYYWFRPLGGVNACSKRERELGIPTVGQSTSPEVVVDTSA